MGWKFQRKRLSEGLGGSKREQDSVWEGACGGLGKGDGVLAKERGYVRWAWSEGVPSGAEGGRGVPSELGRGS